MNVTLRRALAVCVLAGSLALALALAAGVGSAEAKSLVVGPGESIQKAINAAHTGDTIVVKGVHREDVVIRKNGIKLRGDDAVIEAPTRAKADSPCSKAFGPEGICVLGDANLKAETLTGSRVKDVSVTGFTFRGFEDKQQGLFGIDLFGARNATIMGNRFKGNVAGGIIAGENINTTIAKNDVIGNPDTNAAGIFVVGNSRNTTVLKNDVRTIPEGHNAIDVGESINTTVAGNDLIGNWLGVVVDISTGTKILSNDITDSTLGGMAILDSTGTKILSNDVSRFGNTGITIVGPERANNDAKVVGNRVSGGPWGIYVGDTHRGSFAGNTIHDNCAGMFFEAFPGQPVGDFEVKGNTVENNTRKCPAGIEPGREAFSGIGIALLGASGMQLTGNHLSGNVPSGPTAVSGGVVVSTGPEATKPMNNSVTANHFGRNKPDIYWDKSGSGNRFVGNLCDTSVPSRLCN